MRKPTCTRAKHLNAGSNYERDDIDESAFAEFVRTKKEIDKDAILNQKERFSDGQVPGIKIVSGLEDFVIEPTEQELA